MVEKNVKQVLTGEGWPGGREGAEIIPSKPEQQG